MAVRAGILVFGLPPLIPVLALRGLSDMQARRSREYAQKGAHRESVTRALCNAPDREVIRATVPRGGRPVRSAVDPRQ